MKLIFWGTPEVGIPTLRALVQAGHTVCAVVTQPDKEQGRNRQLQASPIKQLAQSLGLAVLQPETPNTDEFVATIKALAAEAMIVVAYGKILSKKLLPLAPHGYINVHFSLLPKYRGASPVLAAILAGETEAGVTIMKIVPKMDAGPILQTTALPILPADTTESLENRLAQCGAPMVLEVLTKLPQGQIVEKTQDDRQATYCHIIKKEEGLIPWEKDAAYLQRFVRAMTPWPTPYTFLYRQARPGESMRIIVKEVEVIPNNQASPPGTILSVTRDHLLVATGQGALQILALQKAGKAVMKCSEFLRGNPVVKGDRCDRDVEKHKG